MSVEERIRFLLRAAVRAEHEGNERAARLFRRRAEDFRPWNLGMDGEMDNVTAVGSP